MLFLFAVAGIVGHIPACAFELDSRSGSQPFQTAAAFAALDWRLVTKFLQYFAASFAFPALKFIDWHELVNSDGP